MNEIIIGDRKIGEAYPPFVIAEVGINHEGDLHKAMKMINDAASVGCECIKFQTHVVEDEMVPNTIIPGNANETIWDIMNRWALNAKEEVELKKHTESKGRIFLSTPFSQNRSVQH